MSFSVLVARVQVNKYRKLHKQLLPVHSQTLQRKGKSREIKGNYKALYVNTQTKKLEKKGRHIAFCVTRKHSKGNCKVFYVKHERKKKTKKKQKQAIAEGFALHANAKNARAITNLFKLHAKRENQHRQLQGFLRYTQVQKVLNPD